MYYFITLSSSLFEPLFGQSRGTVEEAIGCFGNPTFLAFPQLI